MRGVSGSEGSDIKHLQIGMRDCKKLLLARVIARFSRIDFLQTRTPFRCIDAPDVLFNVRDRQMDWNVIGPLTLAASTVF